jgi:hypothetical protein
VQMIHRTLRYKVAEMYFSKIVRFNNQNSDKRGIDKRHIVSIT